MLAENLAMLRSLKGLSQEQAAEIAGVARQSYAKWEQGDTLPDVEKCARLAAFYGVTLDALVNQENRVGAARMAPAPLGKHLWGTVVLGSRGQIVIPKAARETFTLREGDRLVVLGDENEGTAMWKSDRQNANEVIEMKCPQCGKEMKEGYLFTSKDGAFSFADEVPGMFTNASKAPGFVEITPLKASHRVNMKAALCEACRVGLFRY